MTTATPRETSRLPPGQRRIDRFPRFGKDLSGPPPVVPADPIVTIRGVVTEPIDVPIARLADLARREMVADFHCVTGWTVSDVRWEGVAFASFFRDVIQPAIVAGAVVTHVLFRGLDRERALFEIDDALADSVLIADMLDGKLLDGDHGAPVRIVSPDQYGYMSIKHLCRIDVFAGPPAPRRTIPLIERLLESHPRARVWEEERHGSMPSWFVRPIYRAIKRLMLWKSAKGSL